MKLNMGCLFDKSSGANAANNKNASEETAGKYSWDTRTKINPKDYTIENVKDDVAGRMPGTVNGNQFIIQNCEDSSIYIFDYSNTVTVDDCKNCNIFLGPIKGSVFLRNCEECKCIVACQQFRTRDCRKMNILLVCATQPIIEASTGMKFSCFRWSYPELEEQFQSVGLSEFNNNWSDIHDFTPVEGESNWSIYSHDTITDGFIPLPSKEPFSGLTISTNSADCLVPLTYGVQRRNNEGSCLVVFFSDGQAHERARSFIKTMKSCNPSCALITTKEVGLTATEAETVFQTDSYSQVVVRGPLIGLEYSGEGCVQACQKAAMNIATETGSTGLVYVSSNAKSAIKEADRFFNYAQLQLGI